MTATAPATAGAPVIPTLRIDVVDVAAATAAAVPTVEIRLRIGAADARPIRALTLATQVRVAARARPYDAATRARLVDVFGEPSRWDVTLRSLLWTQTTLHVPAFAGTTVVALPLACAPDFELTVVRYVAALPDGDVPLELLFSGTVFWTRADGALQATRLPWDLEARCRLPVRTWREAVDAHFPHAAWLRLDRGTVDRLSAYRAAHAFPSWEAALDALLAQAGR